MVWLLTIPSTLPKLNWKPFSTATTFTCTAGVEYCFLSLCWFRFNGHQQTQSLLFFASLNVFCSTLICSYLHTTTKHSTVYTDIKCQ